MNYEDMSDFEINKLVALIKYQGLIQIESKGDGVFVSRVNDKYDFINIVHSNFDPCNNPSDAWPIIVENEITIAKHISNDEWEAYGGGYEVNYNHEIESCRKSEFMDKNPLRAAMICFLKMKDAEK